jgi:hypothetical protein
VRALALVVAATATALVLGSPAATAPAQTGPPRVCEGLTICVPIAGPWVVVPGPATAHDAGMASWQLACPDGVVGGVDVRASKPWIDVTFPGRIGSPINPGVTTGQDVVFNALSVGPPRRPASFIPFIGCIPSQGGPRQPSGVSVPRQMRPGQPIERRIRVLEVRPGRPARAGLACGRAEHLVSVQTTLGIYTAVPPTARQIASVRVKRSVQAGRIFVSATRRGLAATVPVQVQIHALCGGNAVG